MRETLDSYCRRMNRMDLLEQWDAEKIFRKYLQRSLMEVGGRCGGNVRRDIPGRRLYSSGQRRSWLSGMRGKIPEKTEVYRRNLTEVSIRVMREGGADRLKVLHGEG